MLELSPPATAAQRQLIGHWSDSGVLEGLTAGRADLWGPEAVPEASQRMGWLQLPQRSLDDLPGWIDTVGRLPGSVNRVVVAGMGGSSLGAELIADSLGVSVTVVDTTDPAAVQRRLLADVSATVLVVASKSGSTIETDAHRRTFSAALAATDLSAAERARRIIAITDPGSDLENWALAAGHEVVHGHADVGGRFSVLSAFGLLPAMLAGAEPAQVSELLMAAAAVRPHLADPTGAAAGLAAALVDLARQGRPLLLPGPPAPESHFSDWVEQLVAESTGKQHRGVLPAVGLPAEATDRTAAVPVSLDAPSLAGPLGARLLAWEFATALAAESIGVNPFDQPDVQRAKVRTGEVLATGVGPLPDAAAVQVVGEAAGAVPVEPTAALAEFVAGVPSGGYLAVLAFLDPDGDSGAHALAAAVAAERDDITVTFGWGPRYLHSTGQFHKGGPAVGRFLLLTGGPGPTVTVPGREYDFQTLQWAQALGDVAALTEVGAAVLHLHLSDRSAGLAEMLGR